MVRVSTFKIDDRLRPHHEATLRSGLCDREDGGTLEAAMREVIERAVGVGQRIGVHLGANRDPGRELQELLAVPPGEVCHRADLPFLPQEVIRKRRDVAHVDAGTHHHPPGSSALSAAGTSAPTGAKIKAASSASGGVVSESPAHSAPRLRANCCFLVSPGEVKAKTRRPW